MDFKYQKILWDIENYLQKQNIPQKENSFQWKQVERKGFYIKENIGNNSFNYQLGKKIWVPEAKIGDVNNIQLGKKIVFEDEGIQSIGLVSYIFGYTHTSYTPVYICDNHNFVLEAWNKVKNKKYTLVHIDQHRDDAQFTGDTKKYLETSKICDYIDFSQKEEWIQKEYYSFIEKNDLISLKKVNNENYILNIDIDFFAPELTTISLEEKLNIILFYLGQTEIITLATSPLFINQEFAIEIGKLFWKYL